MGLTSGSLIALLAITAIALNAGTVWLWPRVGGSRVRAGLTRAALLSATQVGLALTVLVALNSYFVFFNDWNELIGMGGAGGGAPAPKAKHAQVKASKSAGPPEVQALGPEAKPSAQPSQAGEVQRIDIHGAATGLTNEAYVMLPPQYFQPQYAKQRFPVVVMLTGYPGNPRGLLHTMHFPDLVKAGWASGKVKPAIYVLMKPTLVPPRDTECTDVPRGPQVESFFAFDVPRSMIANYRAATTRDGWAIAGDSTGGYCAVKIAMGHSDQYSTAVSLSGYFHSLQDMTTGNLYDSNAALRNQNDLLWLIQHQPPPPISVLVTSCIIGEKTYPQAREFLDLAKPPLRADSMILPSGGHNMNTFTRMMPGALEWLSTQLKAE